MDDKGKGKETQSKEKTYTEAEHKGVISDLTSERQQRHDAELKFSQSQAQMDSLKRENEKLKKETEDKESRKSIIEGEGEDFLTKKEGRDIERKVVDSISKAQKIVKEREDKEKEDVEKAKDQKNFNKSEITARTKYAPRKKIGLDYETVKQAALLRLADRKHKQIDIFQSDNPAEELYEEGLKDPEIKEKLELAKNEKILDTMGDHKVDKKGLTGETKNLGFHFYTADEVAKMKPEEARKIRSDIEKSALKW